MTTLPNAVAPGCAALLGVLASACLVAEPTWDGASGGSDGSGTTAGDTGSGGVDAGQSDGQTDGQTDGDGDGDGDGGPGLGLPADCGPLPEPPADATTINPGDDIAAAVAALAPGGTLVFGSGEYPLDSRTPVTITTPDVTLRSATGDAKDVHLAAGGAPGPFFTIAASGVTLAELTVSASSTSVIRIAPGDNPIQDVALYRMNFFDSQRMIEVQSNFDAGIFVDRTVVACNAFVLSAAYRGMEPNCSATAVMHVLGGDAWRFEDNVVQGYWCPSDPVPAAVLFSAGSRDPVVLGNAFVDNHRALILGNDDDQTRVYDNEDCGGFSHANYRGLVANNVFTATADLLGSSANGVDSMISLWNTCGTEVYHNSIYTAFPSFSTIEWRYPSTVVWVANNLSNGSLMPREGAIAYGLESNGMASMEDFVAPLAGDLSLAAGSAAIDAGVPLPDGAVQTDRDGRLRVGAPDQGALEFAP